MALNKGQTVSGKVQSEPQTLKSGDAFEPKGLTTAEIDILTAAAVIMKAKILKEQETESVPNEIITSSGKADRSYHRAMAVAGRALDKAGDICLRFNLGDKFGPKGEILREISEADEDGMQTMTEFQADGEIKRESSFKNGVLQKVAEFNGDGTKNEIKFLNGEINEYTEGFEETNEGKKSTKYMTFSHGRPAIYYEGYEEYKNDSSNIRVGAAFDKGRMTAYYENMKCYEDCSSLVGLHLRYDENGVLYEYVENIKNDFENGMTYGKRLILEDGKWMDKTNEQ